MSTNDEIRKSICKDVELMWQDHKGSNIIDIEKIGYAFRQNKNVELYEPIFWNVTIPIKRSGQCVNLSDLGNFLQMPDLICHCLCIGFMKEDTVEEYIYALCVCQFSKHLDLRSIDRTRQIEIEDLHHMAQSILLCCRRESSEYDRETGAYVPDERPTAKILRNYGFEASWIHEDREDEKYRELQAKALHLLENENNQLEIKLEKNIE